MPRLFSSRLDKDTSPNLPCWGRSSRASWPTIASNSAHVPQGRQQALGVIDDVLIRMKSDARGLHYVDTDQLCYTGSIGRLGFAARTFGRFRMLPVVSGAKY